MRIHPALLLPLAASGLVATAFGTTYVNPDTIPVMLGIPAVYASTKPGYFAPPSQLDLSQYFKEYTTPGPLIRFYVNAPSVNDDGVSVPNSFRIQAWFVNPTPSDEVQDDQNTTEDSDDQRIPFQNLAVMAPTSVMDLIINADGGVSKATPAFNGTVFNAGYTDATNTENDPTTFVSAQFGNYVYDAANTRLRYSNVYWPSSVYHFYNMKEGVVDLLYSTTGEASLLINMRDNSYYESTSTHDPIGKLYSDDSSNDLDILKMICGSHTLYDVARSWSLSSSLLTVPLWRSYTKEMYASSAAPAKNDFITITHATVSDPSGFDRANGLGFIPDPTYDTNEDYEDTDSVNFDDDVDEDGITNENDTDYVAANWTADGAEVDYNTAFKTVFDCSLTPEGIFKFQLKSGTTMNEALYGSYTYYFRVFVKTGTNNGLTGTPYYRGYLTVSLYYPFQMYTGLSASYASSVAYPDKDGKSVTWNWFNSSTYGWFMSQDFPNYRWVYSMDHGWVYMYGDTISSPDGIYWYDAPSSYQSGGDAADYVDDEVGWLWTNYANYPFFYSFKDQGWVVYIRDVDTTSTTTTTDDDTTTTEDTYHERTMGNRLFYSYRQHAYITPNGKDTTMNGGTTTGMKIHGRKFGTGL